MELPILFSGPMVRAILEGRKTQTRRVCKPQPSANAHTSLEDGTPMRSWWETGEHINHCPYGQPGDRLWVREAWRVGKGYDDAPGSVFTSPTVWYEADGNPLLDRVGRYRHARFMPRWASRILLEITDVRVQRVQDIGLEDIQAEGYPDPYLPPDGPYLKWFTELWDSINAKRGFGWNADPWVWVLTFKRVTEAAK